MTEKSLQRGKGTKHLSVKQSERFDSIAIQIKDLRVSNLNTTPCTRALDPFLLIPQVPICIGTPQAQVEASRAFSTIDRVKSRRVTSLGMVIDATCFSWGLL